MTNRIAPLLLAACLLAPAAASAQEARFESPRASAMAGAFSGGGDGNGALYHNPAALILANVYAIELGYRYDEVGKLSSLGVSIADSKTNSSLAGALGYSYGFADDGLGGDITVQEIRAGFGAPIVDGRMSAGLGLKWLTVDRKVGGWDGFTLDAGLVGIVSKNILVGFTAENLVKIEGAPRGRLLTTGVGTFWDSIALMGEWSLDVDTTDEAKNHFAVGGELSFMKEFPLRAGFRRDGVLENSFVSGGVGWRSPMAGLDFAYVQNLDVKTDRSFGVTLSIYR